MRKVIYIAPRIHTNIVQRLDDFVSVGYEVIFISYSGKIARYSSIAKDISFTVEKDIMSTFNVLKVLFWISKNSRSVERVLVRDAYSIQMWLIGTIFNRKTTYIFQHDLKKVTSQFLWRILYRFYHVQSNVSSDILTYGQNFYPLYPASYLNDYRDIQKKSGSVIIISKYETRKNIGRTLRRLQKDFEAISVVGVVKDSNIYKRLCQDFPNVDFYKNLEHRDTLRLLARHETYVLNSVNEPAAISPLEAVLLGVITYSSSSNGTNSYFSIGGDVISDIDSFEFNLEPIQASLQREKLISLLKKYGVNHFQ